MDDEAASPAEAPAPAAAPGPTRATGPAAAGAGFDPFVGARLADRYEILRRIAEGGMGAVYEARHLVLGKRVAVKVLLEKFHEKADLVARLLQEAQLASAIGHDNIVDVTDFGTTADGRSFVVMEYLEGESLAQLVMRDAPLPVERCLHLGRQVASALEAAHEKGIVHRDVKPENVFLLPRGDADFVKVMDFGVSKAVRTRDEGMEHMRLTRTGMVLGTPLYMSPEQARGGEDVDARADVWAVGVMLYECLTGEVPFRANNYLGVISQVLTQEIQPPSALRPELGIPAAVEAVVMRAMEKDRERRYQTMSELVRDLDRLLAGDQNVGLPESAPDPRPAEGPTRPRWHFVAAAVVVIGSGVTLALVQTERERAAEEAEARKAAAAEAASPAVPAASTGSPPPRSVAPPARPAIPAPPPAGGSAGTGGLEREDDPVDTGAEPAHARAERPERKKPRREVRRPAEEGAPPAPPAAPRPAAVEHGGDDHIPAAPDRANIKLKPKKP
jgi:serine/threonine-protein kinase